MKISLSWYGKVAERAMTWGGSSLPCSAQVKVKSLQSLGRIPQPLGSYSTTHGGHSWQGEFLLKGPAGCLQFTKDSTASCCGERNTAPTSHALVTFWEVIDSWKVRQGKDLERDELGHIAEGNKVLFRDGTKTTDTNLDEPGQSVGIFLKIFAPVLCVSQTYWIRNWGCTRGTENSRPLWFWCVLTFGNQWFSWKAFISEFRIYKIQENEFLAGDHQLASDKCVHVVVFSVLPMQCPRHWLAFWMLLLPWSLTFRRLPVLPWKQVLLLWTSLSPSIKEGCVCVYVCTHVHTHPIAQSCPTRCNLMDCSLPSSSVHGIFHARILEWVAISYSRSSQPKDWICISCISSIGRWILYHCTTWNTTQP